MAWFLVIMVIGNWGQGPPFKQRVGTPDTSKALLKSDNLWIPPGLYDEPSCFGCCLFSTGCGLIGYGVYKSLKDTTKAEYYPKFSIGISYSPGIAYAGQLGRRLATGEIDPLHDLYWNNIFEIGARYYFTHRWGLEIGGGYMWTHLKERTSWLRIPVEPEEEPWGAAAGGNEWDIWSGFGFVAFKYNISRNPKTWLTGGLEYYYSKGSCVEIHVRHNHQTGGTDRRTISGHNYGKGYGCFISMGLAKPMSAKISWNAMLNLRYGEAENYKQEIEQEDVVWFKPVDFTFTGLYLKVGISYTSSKKGG